MSADYVRTQLTAAVAPILVPFGFTFFETINRAHKAGQLPKAGWYTVDFIPAIDDPVSLGSPQLFRESGSCVVAIFTAQDITDTEAADAAEVVRDAMVHFQVADAAGNSLRVIDCGPPNDADGGDFRGAWYAMTVDLRYQYDRFR
jgi:hypothetical protein